MKAFRIICLFFLTGCTPVPQGQVEGYRVMKGFVESQKANGLELFGIGMAMPDSIHELSLDLASHEHTNIYQARSLILKTSQEFLDQINSSIRLGPHLAHTPFTVSDLKLGICFWDNRNHFYSPPDIAVVYLMNGKIFYCTYDPTQQKLSSEDVEESYEEAMIAENNSRSTLKVKDERKMANLSSIFGRLPIDFSLGR